MPKWSEAQLAAIETTGTNLVVSASAGSGKTAVLCARMVKRILNDRIPVENLLAMTFTDAAASEMKNRLYAGLDEAEKNTDDPELKKYCADQCAMMGSAMICTIHSFCLTVIKENYFVIGLSPKRIQKIFNEDEMQIMKTEALEKALREMEQKDHEAFILAAEHFSGRPDDFSGLKKTIEQIVQLALNQRDPQSLFDRIRQLAKQPKHIDDMDEELIKMLRLKIKLEMEALEKMLRQLEEICLKENLKEETLQSVQLKRGKLLPIFDTLDPFHYRDFIRVLRNFSSAALKNDKSESYKALRKQINEECQKQTAFWFDEDTLFYDNTHLMPVVSFLLESAERMIALLEAAKEENEGLDFSDMEHLAYRILSAPDHAAQLRYQKRFDEILVDEFQDTNDIQNEMIEMISRGNNIFRVGDIKQSIYRFRGAKPSIMQRLMKRTDERHKPLVLHHNYRSSRSIIEFNNLLFDRLMNVSGLNNEFSADDAALTGTLAQDDGYRWPVTFLKIEKSQTDQNEKQKALNPRAMILAQKILDMKNTTEFSHWRDYCVLVRSHAIKDDIRFVFETLNIPYTTTLKTGFFKSSSIRILTSWLELLQDPNQDIAAVSILSGMYGYSDEALARLQLSRMNKPFALAAAEQDEAFAWDWRTVKSLLYKEGITAVLSRLLIIRDFYHNQLDNQERANVDLFLAKARNAEQRASSLSLFLKEIHASQDQPSSTAIAASRSDDVVQITTIHQSKGLQYPVVFFWSGSRTVINDELSACMVDETLGLGLYHLEYPYRYKRPTLQRTAIMMKNALEEFSENVRLYYVALTRAQKAGFILDEVDPDKTFEALSLSSFFAKKGSTALILSALKDAAVPYYKEEFISPDYRSVYQAQKPKAEIVTPPRYSGAQKETAFSIETPSSLEETPLRPLTFSTPHGAKRGVRLHKTACLLLNPPWNSALIKQIEPKLYYNEINALLALGNNPFFIELNQKEVHKEFAFAIMREDKITHGFVDFLAVDQDSFTIVDYKSDHDVDEAELIERYKAQLDAYEDNLKQLYPNKISHKYIYSFQLEKFIAL